MGGACGKGGDAPNAMHLEVGPHALGRALVGKELVVHHGWNDAIMPIPDTVRAPARQRRGSQRSRSRHTRRQAANPPAHTHTTTTTFL